MKNRYTTIVQHAYVQRYVIARLANTHIYTYVNNHVLLAHDYFMFILIYIYIYIYIGYVYIYIYIYVCRCAVLLYTCIHITMSATIVQGNVERYTQIPCTEIYPNNCPPPGSLLPGKKLKILKAVNISQGDLHGAKIVQT